MPKLSVLEYLQHQLAGTLTLDMESTMKYPTAISQTLAISITEVARGTATVEINADTTIHGNQQGTVHGGLICELADAAIGTAHSTLMEEGQSFTTIELKINFYRPVWQSRLRAIARPLQSGKTITHYLCEVKNNEDKVVATVTSTVMTLYEDKAKGR
ncbi:PaaI family thioesterase [Mucilaginibacter jinjuensis]|uniref:PaaI family thioesterase n=1 Tax=Mucilaginibacter jinjuensis TaxID=1176721 RepID=A0ABY7T2D4_9SPHI|nr:PaaI family thioesterase [Mucilaginibacter jinjuensis]WCT10330.1 PaaI family thioesterase [Mucilaginibacter jinjuensis]